MKTPTVKLSSLFLAIGLLLVYMTINSDRYARATISGITPGKLIWFGRVETLSDSHVFKGRNSI